MDFFLADLTLADCDNITGMASHEKEKIMLESAKENLQSMEFLGLTEYQGENKSLFENDNVVGVDVEADVRVRVFTLLAIFSSSAKLPKCLFDLPLKSWRESLNNQERQEKHRTGEKSSAGVLLRNLLVPLHDPTKGWAVMGILLLLSTANGFAFIELCYSTKLWLFPFWSYDDETLCECYFTVTGPFGVPARTCVVL